MTEFDKAGLNGGLNPKTFIKEDDFVHLFVDISTTGMGISLELTDAYGVPDDLEITISSAIQREFAPFPAVHFGKGKGKGVGMTGMGTLEVCGDFRRGDCRRGLTCRYSHDLGEGQSPVAAAVGSTKSSAAVPDQQAYLQLYAAYAAAGMQFPVGLGDAAAANAGVENPLKARLAERSSPY